VDLKEKRGLVKQIQNRRSPDHDTQGRKKGVIEPEEKRIRKLQRIFIRAGLPGMREGGGGMIKRGKKGAKLGF